MSPSRFRRAWLAARARIDRLRPRPIVIRLANVGSVSFPRRRARRIWELALEQVGVAGPPDVVLACEMADVSAVDTAVWQVIQFGEPGSPESALVMAARRSRAELRKPRLVPGSDATSEGRGIRRRPILLAKLRLDGRSRFAWSRLVALTHSPPARAPEARDESLTAFQRVPGSLKAGDLNIAHLWALRLLGGRVYSDGVLHFRVPRWIPSSMYLVDIGSDHLALDVVLWPRRRR